MELKKFIENTEGMDPKRFDEYLNQNQISHEWLDVSLINRNEGHYNVYLNDYDLTAYAYNGETVQIG